MPQRASAESKVLYKHYDFENQLSPCNEMQPRAEQLVADKVVEILLVEKDLFG